MVPAAYPCLSENDWRFAEHSKNGITDWTLTASERVRCWRKLVTVTFRLVSGFHLWLLVEGMGF